MSLKFYNHKLIYYGWGWSTPYHRGALCTWRAQGNTLKEVDTAFKAFVEEVSANYGRDMTDGPNSLRRAYHAFWEVYKENKQ